MHQSQASRGERRPQKRERSQARLGDTCLAVSGLALGDEEVHGLIDAWIVPALVERFLSEMSVFPDSTEEGHN
jgi:hypothetical protein